MEGLEELGTEAGRPLAASLAAPGRGIASVQHVADFGGRDAPALSPPKEAVQQCAGGPGLVLRTSLWRRRPPWHVGVLGPLASRADFWVVPGGGVSHAPCTQSRAPLPSLAPPCLCPTPSFALTFPRHVCPSCACALAQDEEALAAFMAPRGAGAKQRTLSDMILDKIRQAQQEQGLTEIPKCASLAGGLGWAGLGWAGLGWAGLGWAGLGWAFALVVMELLDGFL